MITLYPAGAQAARDVLQRFLQTKARQSQLADASPLSEGAENSSTKSRIKEYMSDRNEADKDSTSRMSPYLSSGVMSARACVRATMAFAGVRKVDASKTSGPGVWVSEVGAGAYIRFVAFWWADRLV